MFMIHKLWSANENVWDFKCVKENVGGTYDRLNGISHLSAHLHLYLGKSSLSKYIQIGHTTYSEQGGCLVIHAGRMHIVWSVVGVPTKPSAAMEDTSANYMLLGQQCPGAVTRWSSGEV